MTRRAGAGALRVFATARPGLIGAKVLPMTREDEDFWRRLRERREQEAAK